MEGKALEFDYVTGYWQQFLRKEATKDYFLKLDKFLDIEQNNGKKTYPPSNEIFTAFSLTPFENIKCVILGQDPYFLEGLAHGLAFSVKKGIPAPRSLVNIYKEMNSDLNLSRPEGGNLSKWADQGVFLLNSALTVEEGKAGSHKRKGWENLTVKAIQEINRKKESVVFLAWGKDAHKVCQHVDLTKHHVIQTSHPSPLGATKAGKDFDAFLGSNCFSLANEWLQSRAVTPVNWSLT